MLWLVLQLASHAPHFSKLLPNVQSAPNVPGVEIKKKCGVRYFWNFDKISLIIVDKAFAVEWDYSFS